MSTATGRTNRFSIAVIVAVAAGGVAVGPVDRRLERERPAGALRHEVAGDIAPTDRSDALIHDASDHAHTGRQSELIGDGLGFVPLSKTGAEVLFEVFRQRYERGSTLVTSNLPFQEWTEVLGSERLTGALLDRLTHHVHILEMNGESYRLKESKRNRPGKPASRS